MDVPVNVLSVLSVFFYTRVCECEKFKSGPR